MYLEEERVPKGRRLNLKQIYDYCCIENLIFDSRL